MISLGQRNRNMDLNIVISDIAIEQKSEITTPVKLVIVWDCVTSFRYQLNYISSNIYSLSGISVVLMMPENSNKFKLEQ